MSLGRSCSRWSNDPLRENRPNNNKNWSDITEHDSEMEEMVSLHPDSEEILDADLNITAHNNTDPERNSSDMGKQVKEKFHSITNLNKDSGLVVPETPQPLPQREPKQ